MTGASSHVIDFEAQTHALGRAGERLRRRLGEATFWAWFRSAWIANDSGSVVRIAVAGHFARDWIANHYDLDLIDAFRRENPACERVEIVVRQHRGAQS